MTFQSILTTLTDKSEVRPILDHATTVAESYRAHLDVLCLGVDRSNLGYYYEGASAVALQESIDRARADAEAIEQAAAAVLTASGLRYGTDAEVAQLADIGRHVAERARFSDLVVLPQPYGTDKGAELEAVLEAALFDGRAPVLVMPTTGKLVAKPKRVMVAWNESTEALSAVRAALPILKHAETTQIVVIDPPVHGRNRSDPGGLLAQFLTRHGVHAEIDVLSKTMPRVSDIIKRHATDSAAEMIVMGAYGHSRFREAILGGATRNMLEEMPVPVFMAH
ncbi:universal stress protein [Pseudooceanicola sp.]|uniref:universal stress protein n=1 Tax=Pseudooceanicola sp. TaxID=1914328 RepID=UPI00262DD412|nr:universal stress protein [Pseudooceanicola sp.]MDF1856694.1 universal stress protein [Pseudooceanicola sp.]